EFSGRVNRLARHLVSLGVGPESRVAVAMRRGTDLLTAMYAVITAGGGYVPVDPDHPAERIGYVLESADPVLVLSTTDAGFDAGDRSVPGAEPAERPLLCIDTVDLSAYADVPVTDSDRLAPLRAGNTAYVLYTSGSTGRPKGVAVTHRAVVNQVAWFAERFDVTDSDIVLWKTPATFDASVWELFVGLSVGAALVVAEPEGHRDPAYLSALIDEQSVTVVQFVPAMLPVFLAEIPAGGYGALRAVFTGGEALGGDVAQQLRLAVPGVEVHNLYGPTEATVQVTHGDRCGCVCGADRVAGVEHRGSCAGCPVAAGPVRGRGRVVCGRCPVGARLLRSGGPVGGAVHREPVRCRWPVVSHG
ncbi:AMP-binding protein, partial [Aldersonia sp. NBC_00410]|nr:AMP-binding protein [Aldersonia sp. NBC_00410]